MVAEYPNASDRLRVVLSNQVSDQGLPALLRIVRPDTSSSTTAINTASGFKSQATSVMASDSYMGIRTDALLLEAVSSGSANIVKQLLIG